MMQQEEMIIKTLSELPSYTPQALYSYLLEQKREQSGELCIDTFGNLQYHKAGRGKKIQIIFHMTSPTLLVGSVKENNAEVSFLGTKANNQERDQIFYNEGKPVGILREKESDNFFLEIFPDTTCKSGMFLQTKCNIICKGGQLYGNKLSMIIPLYLATCLFEFADLNDKDITFTIWNSSFLENIAVSSLSDGHIYEETLVFSLVPEKENCKVGQGPSLCFKDGCYVASPSVKERLQDVARMVGVEMQSYLGKTNRAMELLSLQQSFPSPGGIYCPVLHSQTANEEIIWEDVEKTRNFLLKYIEVI